MPLSPQIVIVPDEIVTKNFDISAVSYTSSTATYTATGHTFSAGDIVLVSDLAPDGYNGTFTISSVATNTFTVPNTTNTAVTDAVGNAFWTDPTEYAYEGLTSTFLTDNNDLADPTVNPAIAQAAAAVTAANAAAATAGTAQATANTALTNAATAYTTAVNSLQPSAYAIQNPTTKQLTSIDATGLTVYSGASATSGARVVLNSTGLAGFNSGGTATFSISASTGAAVFSGSVTGATITASTMNIGGNAIIDSSGLLTATGATIKGTINALDGYFGTATNGWSISTTGLVGVGSGTIVTSTGSNAIVLSSTDNAIGIKSGGSYAGWIGSVGSGALLMHYGSTPSSTAYPRAQVSSTTASLAADGSNSLSITTSGNNMQGNMTFNGTSTSVANSLNITGTAYYTGIATGSGTGVVCATSGQRLGLAPSSERFKQDIKYIATTGWLNKVLQIKPISYIIDKDFVPADEENPTQIGFLAEDIYELGGGLEYAVNLDPLGEPFSLAYDRFTVFLTLAIKELKAEIDKLKGE